HALDARLGEVLAVVSARHRIASAHSPFLVLTVLALAPAPELTHPLDLDLDFNLARSRSHSPHCGTTIFLPSFSPSRAFLARARPDPLAALPAIAAYTPTPVRALVTCTLPSKQLACPDAHYRLTCRLWPTVAARSPGYPFVARPAAVVTEVNPPAT
ncbi:hypothetical protein FRC08_013048, partial [Ceratobasidium sp. 394]